MPCLNSRSNIILYNAIFQQLKMIFLVIIRCMRILIFSTFISFCFAVFNERNFEHYNDVKDNFQILSDTNNYVYSSIIRYLEDSLISGFDDYNYGFSLIGIKSTTINYDILNNKILFRTKKSYLDNVLYINQYIKAPFFLFDFVFSNSLWTTEETIKNLTNNSEIRAPLDVSDLESNEEKLIDTYESMAANSLQNLVMVDMYNENSTNNLISDQQLLNEIDNTTISTVKTLKASIANQKLTNTKYNENLNSKKEVKILRQQVIALAQLLYSIEEKTRQKEKIELILASLISQNQDTINGIKDVIAPV